MGKLHDYIERVFGFPTRTVEDPLLTQATTTAKMAFANNPDRIMALIANLGDYKIYWGLDSRISATRGVPIDAAGGKDVLIADEDGELVGREIWIVGEGTTAIKTLAVEAA